MNPFEFVLKKYFSSKKTKGNEYLSKRSEVRIIILFKIRKHQ